MIKTLKLKDGREVILRNLTEQDAPAIKSYINQVAGETDFLLLAADELTLSDEQEAAFIRSVQETPGSLMLCAEYEGHIIANASIQGNAKKRMAHTAEIGLTVAKSFWRLGLGRILLNELIEHAKKSDIKIIHLSANARNEAALALYRSCGFEAIGLYKKMLLVNGVYTDGVLMNLYL